jgi:glycosyltransferase involved in cell wall biosynthesis
MSPQPLSATGRTVAVFEALAAAHDLLARLRFVGPKPARDGFALGHILVVPSRAESLPYVVLEGAAVGVPMIATRVGGIGEIFGPDASAALIPAADARALARAIADALDDPAAAQAAAKRLQARVRAAFSVDAMTEAVLSAYRDALSRRDGPSGRYLQGILNLS